MQSSRVLLTSLALFSLVGCARQADLDSVRRDADEMKSHIFTIERGLGDVRGEVKEGVDKSLAGYRKNVEALQKGLEAYQKEMGGIRKSGADLQATLDSARVDMQLVTGKVDDVRIMAQKQADDVALFKDDTGKRLASLEERLTRLEQSLTGLAEQQKKAAEQQQTPEFLYQQAFEAMKAGDPAKSRELFA